MLQRIAEGPPARSRHCVRLLDSFDHRGPNGLHVCMVFEVRRRAVTGCCDTWLQLRLPAQLRARHHLHGRASCFAVSAQRCES